MLQGPSAEHWLGTDTLGRDVLSRMLYGISPTASGAAQALIVFLALGIPLGVIAGYRGGLADQVISRVADLALSIPPIIIVLVVIVVSAGRPVAAMASLGVLGAPGLIRVVRAASAAVRDELFVTAAKVSGVSQLRIMRTHVLRRIRGPVVVQASLFGGVALLFQAGLSFLGLLDPDRPTWGAIMGEASTVITQSQWLLIPPGVAITLTVLALGFLGDAVRDASADTDAVATAKASREAASPRTSTATSAALPDPSDYVLSVRELHVHTTSGVPLITDISFDLAAGETVGLVGESGCGKSITALAVLGLTPGGIRIAGGGVYFDGTDLVAGGEAAYRRIRGSGLGYISQDPMAALDPVHTVGSHLNEVLKLRGVGSSAARRERALELLSQVHIADPQRVLKSYPHQISGGMAQRISIAIALAGRPRVLVADEPTTALDVTVQSEILSLLHELQETTGLALLLITHDWGVVADICDRAVVMYAGDVVEVAPAHTVFTAPTHPYTAALLAADPSIEHSGRLPTLPGRVPAPGLWPQGCRFAARCRLATEACSEARVPLIKTSEALSRCLHTDLLKLEKRA
ncbi:peptide/nickel transport system permease protein [Nocardioides alpinus]|uniref:Peptide ABC transporter ATP-binding protein n=1 Tax=Nocardioides alpinus TaxID=748909 RepID=A0A1I1BC89_9ACTN|nr:peptide ABC transporter ATP-binding protein [Nocardioides alpinus]SFB47969.1 peptide/nickel transport system permease protein [Nocardioides alpinus]